MIMSELFSYYDGELDEFIADAMLNSGEFIKRVISDVSANLVEDLRQRNVIVDVTWKHTLDNSAVCHTIRIHGSDKEALRGQLPVTEADLLLIPDIVQNYDIIIIEKNRRGQDVIIYSKEMADGVTYYVEEVRQGRRELAASTMYKRKKRKLTDANGPATQISDLFSF